VLPHVNAQTASRLKQRLETLKAVNTPLLDFIRTLKTGDVSEERWLRYYDEVFSDCELAAMEHLYRELKSKR
jgi:hypothetical protein